LIDYTKVHFAHEEKLMAEHGYPDSPGHKAEHVALAKQVLDVQAKFKSGASAVLSMDVLNFLKEWLLKHIQGTDKKYVAHFKSKGVK
jgi:hemerythrin